MIKIKRKLYSVIDEEERLYARGTKEAGKAAKEFLKKKSRSNTERFRNKMVDAFKNSRQDREIAVGQRYVDGGFKVVHEPDRVAALAGGGTEIIPGSSSRVYVPGHYKNISVRPGELVDSAKKIDDAQVNRFKKNVRTAGRKLKTGKYDLGDYYDFPTKGRDPKENLANAYMTSMASARYRRRSNQGIDLLKFREKLKGRKFYANGTYGEHPYLTQKELLKVAENEKRKPYSDIRHLIN